MDQAEPNGGEPFGKHGRELLELIATGMPLPGLLRGIVELVESQAPGMLCSILLLDDATSTLNHGAAPSLPEEYVRAIDGATIGPRAGSCGAAAFFRTRIIVEDIGTHPYWEAYKQLALPHNLLACWSTPIVAGDGDVLGTFAMYFEEKRRPVAREVVWVDAATHLASIAITRDRSDRSLKEAEARARQLARLYAVSSSVADAIVRVRSPRELYDAACRIAVEQGLAHLAWVGMYEPGSDHFRAVARHGRDDGYIDAITLSLIEADRNKGPAARALVTGVCAISHDIESDPDFFWKEAALSRGLRSCAAFPLKVDGHRIGILVIYVDRPGYFGSEEVRVLGALADNIAFAVESTLVEGERRRLLVDLGERVKELTLLHRVAHLLQGAATFDAPLMRALVAEMPAAWLHPEICAARVIWNGITASTPQWRETPLKIAAAIEAGVARGVLEVVYLQEFVDGMPVTFLPEEVQLMQSLARMLSTHLGRELATAALRKSEERLRSVIEHTPNVGIQWYDSDTRLLFSNKASLTMFGRTAEAALGRTVDLDHFSADEAMRFADAVDSVARTGEPAGPIEFAYRRPDGSTGTLLTTIFRIPDASGLPCFVCMDVDLTDQKRAEEARHELEAQLEQSKRLQALGTLASGIAHDFNNILTAIAGNAGLALNDVPPESEACTCLREIHTAAQRASDLVRQILTFGRPELSRRETVSLRSVAEETIGLVRATLPATVAIQLSDTGNTPDIIADPSQIHQILMNLLTNAVQAIGPSGGVVEIFTGRHEIRESTRGRVKGVYARLTIRDSGTGMDASTVARVFEPFFTTKTGGRGTGLGLSVVHGIVMSHEGSVTVRSQPGMGTVFELLFPAAAQGPGAKSPAPHTAAS